MDWNYIGVPRPRPNKWYVEPITIVKNKVTTQIQDSNLNLVTQNKISEANPHPLRLFKEWSFATDDHSQSYYFETWEDKSISRDIVLVLRKAPSNQQPSTEADRREDGLLVVVGNHFNYLHGRRQGWKNVVQTLINQLGENTSPGNLVELVDAAIERGLNRNLVEHLLDVDAGHGLVHSDENEFRTWTLDCAIQPWKEGSSLFQGATLKLVVPPNSNKIHDCYLMWNQERWNIFESSITSISMLTELFRISQNQAVTTTTTMSKLKYRDNLTSKL